MLSAVVALGAISGTAVATGYLPTPTLTPPLLLRLTGTWEHERAAAVRHGARVASFALPGDPARLYFLGIDEARTVGGDQTLSGNAVLNALDPFSPSFIARGSDEATAALRRLPPGTRVIVEGLVARPSRTLLLRSVEVDGEITR